MKCNNIILIKCNKRRKGIVLIFKMFNDVFFLKIF